MEIGGKLMVLILLDLAVLAHIIYRLMRAGNTYAQALQIVWELVFFKSGFNDLRVFAKTDWMMVFKSIWWFTGFLCLTVWILTGGFIPSLVVLFLFLIHVYGYYHYRKVSLRTLERFVYMNGAWGIIYLSIAQDSLLKSKSLAELDLRKKNLLVLAVERNGEVVAFPKGMETLGVGDRLLIFGDLNCYRSMCY